MCNRSDSDLFVINLRI